MANQWKEQCKRDAIILPVEEQYELAKKLATNCGYQLVAEDDERSLDIKNIKEKISKGYGGLPLDFRKIIIEGLEALLK